MSDGYLLVDALSDDRDSPCTGCAHYTQTFAFCVPLIPQCSGNGTQNNDGVSRIFILDTPEARAVYLAERLGT